MGVLQIYFIGPGQFSSQYSCMNKRDNCKGEMNIIGFHTLKIELVTRTTSKREACLTPPLLQKPRTKALPMKCYE
jgi:hypothetical protein